MSFIQKIFNSDGKKEPPTVPKAIEKLRHIEEMLIKKQEFLESKVQAELATVKANGTKNKRVALAALKRKKRYESQLQKLDGTLATLELQRESLEVAGTNAAVLETMRIAADALKRSHKDLNADKVHDVLDDVAEQQEISEEIGQAISMAARSGADFMDDDDLLKELEEMEQEELDRELLSVGATPLDLPSVPSASVQATAPSSEEQKELDKLKQWAA